MAEEFFKGLNKTLEQQYMIYNMHGECINSEFNIPPPPKNKVFFIGAHPNNTNHFSKIGWNLLCELAKSDRLAVTHYAIDKSSFKYGVRHPYPKNVHEINAGGDVEAVYNLREILDEQKPDIIFIHSYMMDILKYLNEIYRCEDDYTKKSWKVYVYLNKKSTTMDYGVITRLNTGIDKIYVYNSKWRQLMIDGGLTETPIEVLIPGIDEVYKRRDKVSTRELLKVPSDAFIVLSVNKNRENKAYDVLIKGFVKFLKKYADVESRKPYLMCICDTGEKTGWNLADIFNHELIQNGLDVDKYTPRLMIASNPYMFTNEEINMFYNIADIGLSMSSMEGFNMFAYECLSVGVPQVLTDIEGHADIFTEENSIKIMCEGSDADKRATDCADALEKYYMNEEECMKAGIMGIKQLEKNGWDSMCKNLINQLSKL
jgi:glycosyltransferase involved in cell wall biosynthesis